ncbi:Fungal specific transcription factor domain family protein [Clavispora lusitaniae]|uniref:Fungal specific transcription factor domain family protein n=1 Tax=Clavispora lusitaniae TaxID=36911 RepID=UPI00202BE572|nr:Fungal specific transcription factor domain family protein [Clavispora lusitaniae]
MSRPTKRQRVSTACNRCRKSKIKCSGDFPCSKCEKMGVKCSFAEMPSEPSVLASYVPAPIGKPKEVKGSPQSTGEHIGDKNYDLISCVIQWRVYARSQLLLLRELCKSNLDQIPAEKNPGLKVPRIHNYGWNMSGIQYLERRRLPERPSFNFSTSFAELMDYFFAEVNPLFEIVSKEIQEFFQTKFHSFMRASAHPSLKTKSDVHLHSATLYLIFAIAIRFTEFTRPQGPRKSRLELETECFSYAYEVIETISTEYFSLELIQGWLLVSLYLRITYNQRSLMRALDSANCMARTMGLHQNRVMKTKADSTKRKAMHLFWTVYTFDQVFSIQLGRPSFWRNEEITVPFPNEKEVFWTMNKPPTLPFAMFKIGLIAHDAQRTKWDEVEDIHILSTAERLESTYQWLKANGMITDGSLSLAENQIALHFYDVAFAFHSPILFNFVGKKYISRGMSIDALLKYMGEMLFLAEKNVKCGKDKAPWYNTLSLLFSVGTFSLILVNGGSANPKPRQMYIAAINMLKGIGSYENEEGSSLYPMANECVWALSQGVQSMKIRFEQEIDLMSSVDLGDHRGYSNEHNFGLMGRFREYSQDELPKLEEYDTNGDSQGANLNEMGNLAETGDLDVDDMLRQLTSGTWLDSLGGDLFEENMNLVS